MIIFIFGEDSVDFKFLEIFFDGLDMLLSLDNREFSFVGEMENKIDSIYKSLVDEFYFDVDLLKYLN